jgi:hypothetical protein
MTGLIGAMFSSALNGFHGMCLFFGLLLLLA